jgi:hypothetical protein
MLVLQYIAVLAALAAGIAVIRRGVIIEPPAFVNRLASLLTERAKRLAPQ